MSDAPLSPASPEHETSPKAGAAVGEAFANLVARVPYEEAGPVFLISATIYIFVKAVPSYAPFQPTLFGVLAFGAVVLLCGTVIVACLCFMWTRNKSRTAKPAVATSGYLSPDHLKQELEHAAKLSKHNAPIDQGGGNV
jgi:hypothetical protein